MPVRQSAYARGHRYNRTTAQSYVYGNVVTKPVYEPEIRTREPERRHVSRQVKSNRHKAFHITSGYVMFLAIAAILALAVCVNYVQFQAQLASRADNITAMQEELANRKEENNTRYNAIMDAVNLDEVRAAAQEELGMVYASTEQVIEYDSPSADYVKQYENIPEDGVLAKSDKHID